MASLGLTYAASKFPAPPVQEFVPVKEIDTTDKVKLPSHIGGDDVAGGAKNVVGHQKNKSLLDATEKANPLVENLKSSGKLPDNYVTKSIAKQNGWREGKAIGNYVKNGQIGGDVFRNKPPSLPYQTERIWYEADIGLTPSMSRAKQPGTRLLYSNDGLMYITTDHYNTFHYIGNYK